MAKKHGFFKLTVKGFKEEQGNIIELVISID